jgi:hypothetical protein
MREHLEGKLPSAAVASEMAGWQWLCWDWDHCCYHWWWCCCYHCPNYCRCCLATCCERSWRQCCSSRDSPRVADEGDEDEGDDKADEGDDDPPAPTFSIPIVGAGRNDKADEGDDDEGDDKADEGDDDQLAPTFSIPTQDATTRPTRATMTRATTRPTWATSDEGDDDEGDVSSQDAKEAAE